MKSKKNISIDNEVRKLNTKNGILYIEYCDNSILDLKKYFTDEDLIKSFPPDGILEVSELDYFFYIKCDSEVVGFYRIIDLFFDEVLELHGSFNKYDTFLVKSYFELTKIFVSQVMEMFPNKKIISLANISNTRVQRFLIYLNFIKTGYEKNNENFLTYEKIANMKVKIIKSYNSDSIKDTKNFIYLEDGENKFHFHDTFFLENHSFSQGNRIFKITNYFDKNGTKKSKTIFRKAISGNRKRELGSLKKNEVALLPRDIAILNINKQLDNVNIKIKGKKFYILPFYWYNPSYSVRISFISLVLALLSIVLTIISTII